VDFFSYHTRGTKMENKNEKHKTKTIPIKTMTTRTAQRTYEISDMEGSPFERRGSVHRSPPDTATMREAGDIPEVGDILTLEKQGHTVSEPSEKVADSRDKKGILETTKCTIKDPEIENVSDLRSELELFLFNDSNKISKPAIKFIMGKWNDLESRMYEVQMDNNRLKGRLVERQTDEKLYLPGSVLPTQGRSYASITALSTGEVRPKPAAQQCVLLIRPEKETDIRDNDKIKESFCKLLENQRSKLKIKGIRKMRNKGLVAEFDSNADINIIRQADLSKGAKSGDPN